MSRRLTKPARAQALQTSPEEGPPHILQLLAPALGPHLMLLRDCADFNIEYLTPGCLSSKIFSAALTSFLIAPLPYGQAELAIGIPFR
ncbi:MAG: hypothetical protein QXG32_04095 [Candidatus Bathyarchaeia archaeon]